MGCKGSKSGKAKARAADGLLGVRQFVNFRAKLEAEWAAGDKDGDGSLSYEEVKRLLHKLNLSIPERQLKHDFGRFDADGNNSLSFEEFEHLFQTVRSLPDMKEVFKLACGGDNEMVAEDLRRFMLSSSLNKIRLSLSECAKLILEHEGASEKECEEILSAADKDINKSTEPFETAPVLTYDGFLRLMTDPSFNNVMDAEKYQHVYQDMTQPLSSYFISSSHNTYLKGNQLNGESSPDAISRAIKSGVRVIEIDAWDGGNLSEGPIVNHGHTMCKPTSLKGCLEVMAKEGFKHSEYPLIITIENHCSPPFQKVQMEMLSTIFGARLFLWGGADIDGKKDWTVGPAEWMSPEDLKGKVVIRDKPIKKKQKKNSKLPQEPSPMLETDLNMSMRGVGVNDEILVRNEVVPANSDDYSSGDEEEEEEDSETAQRLGVDSQLLKAMYIKNVKIKASVNKEGGVVVYAEPQFRSSSSLVEGKMLKLSKPGYAARDLAKYAQRHLVRVYPNGSRVDSSNYDPCPAWNAGCQVVALNYQSNSLPKWIAQGKFSDNGGCGYVLKPDFLRSGSNNLWDAAPSEELIQMEVTVLSGHYLPKPLKKSEKSEVIDPYVNVFVHGVESDCKKCSTAAVSNNGFNPKWNETFTFSLRAPELAYLTFTVNDHEMVGKHELVGQTSFPVCALIPGFKVVPLRFDNGAIQDAFLFVKIQFSPNPPISSTEA